MEGCSEPSPAPEGKDAAVLLRFADRQLRPEATDL